MVQIYIDEQKNVTKILYTMRHKSCLSKKFGLLIQESAAAMGKMPHLKPSCPRVLTVTLAPQIQITATDSSRVASEQMNMSSHVRSFNMKNLPHPQ